MRVRRARLEAASILVGGAALALTGVLFALVPRIELRHVGYLSAMVIDHIPVLRFYVLLAGLGVAAFALAPALGDLVAFGRGRWRAAYT